MGGPLSYYPDLSTYTYHAKVIDPHVLNIGWLDGIHPFHTGATSEAFLERLWLFCQRSVQTARGFHDCELCQEARSRLIERSSDKKLMLGAAQIRIPGKNNSSYAAPDLIYHYITMHQYRPPEEFVQAVLSAPLPTSSAYIEFLEQQSVDYVFRDDKGKIIAAGGGYSFLLDNKL